MVGGNGGPTEKVARAGRHRHRPRPVSERLIREWVGGNGEPTEKAACVGRCTTLALSRDQCPWGRKEEDEEEEEDDDEHIILPSKKNRRLVHSCSHGMY